MIKEEKSRQERIPVLGKLVDKALAEPLHNTNNAWQYFHKQLLNLAFDVSSIPKGVHDVDELPVNCPLLLYLNTIKDQIKCNLLYIKLRRWFQSGVSKSLDYRFTGKESKLFSHNFMYLISVLEVTVTYPTASWVYILEMLYPCILDKL